MKIDTVTRIADRSDRTGLQLDEVEELRELAHGLGRQAPLGGDPREGRECRRLRHWALTQTPAPYAPATVSRETSATVAPRTPATVSRETSATVAPSTSDRFT